MKLRTYERLLLLNVLPREGDLTMIRIVRQLREALSFTEEEHAALNVRQGQDWAGGCPRCGSEDVEYPGPEMRLSPERKCTKCGYEGMDGQGRMFWNRDAESENEIPMGKKAQWVVEQRLRELHKEQKLLEDHWSLCEKFGVIEDEES